MEVKGIDVVRRFSPNAQPSYVQAFESGQAILDQYGINRPLRLAHFMAQVMHETGLRTLREKGGYTAENLARMWDKGSWHRYFRDREHCISYAERCAVDGGVQLFNLVYSNRRGNGPPESGDGWKYRGGGLLQTTGRVDYTRYSEIFDVDFVGQPDLIYESEYALRPALEEWREGNLNVAADRNDIEVITRRINGSLKSVIERRAKFQRIWAYVSVQDPVEQSREWTVQEKLKAAGHNDVEPDGVVGPITRAAILSYRARNGLSPGLNIDAELLDSLGLNELAAIERLPDRPPSTLAVPPSPDAGKIPGLVALGSSAVGLAAARAAARARLDGYPTNGCAAHLGALMNQAGIDVRQTSGAGKLVSRLKLRGWRRVDVGQQAPGDVGVTLDNDPTPPGADHVYLVIENLDGDDMMIADNQNPNDASHRRRASGGGKTPTEYFLRA